MLKNDTFQNTLIKLLLQHRKNNLKNKIKRDDVVRGGCSGHKDLKKRSEGDEATGSDGWRQEGVPGVSNGISMGDILHLHSGRDPVSSESLYMRHRSWPTASS